MFDKILVCVDGSADATDAAQTAASIARSFNSTVLALNIYRQPYADPTNIGVWGLAIDQELIERSAKSWLAKIEPEVRRVFEPLNIPFRMLQEAGHEAEVDAILRVAEREDAKLIVLGSRGLRGVTELFLGSVSAGVLHHASCPVLIVRGENAPCGTGKFRNIVLASDGSPFAQRAAAVAVEMAQKYATSLTVLNVYEPLSSAYPPGKGEDVVRSADDGLYAKQWMEYVAEPIRNLAKEAGVYCTFVQVVGKTEETILNFAGKHGVDLIVLGSRGLRGYQRMLLGSVSNRVLHQADCPVLVVR